PSATTLPLAARLVLDPPWAADWTAPGVAVAAPVCPGRFSRPVCKAAKPPAARNNRTIIDIINQRLIFNPLVLYFLLLPSLAKQTFAKGATGLVVRCIPAHSTSAARTEQIYRVLGS